LTNDDRWPNDARSCVALAFDLDGPTGPQMIDGSVWRLPRRFCLGGYGPFRALPRILGILDTFQLPATFFVPAWVVEHWPRECKSIVDHGHEVAHHGYMHECFWDLTVDEQHEVIRKSQEIFTRVLGTPAVGFRAPTGDWHLQTPRLLLEHGIFYSSSLRDDDRPYRHVINGSLSELVEIPTRVDMDDYSCFAYFRNPDFPPGQDRIASYRLTLDNWRREFDGFHEIGGCFTTIFHPEVSGTPGRVIVLEQLLQHLTEQSGVWFARCREVATWWRSGTVAGHHTGVPQ
jgi:peptidoglycan/xylan/chitin deacetylase (PgdA/CDA1 family)